MGKRTWSGAGKANTANGVFTPNSSVQDLKYVEHRPEEEVTLECKTCGYRIVSSWWFVQKASKPRVIVPRNGHLKEGRHAPLCGKYRSIDGRACILDRVDNLDKCEHEMTKSQCKRCK